jgi:dTDP-4-amino-4,6-dideoxygalactose transaminase
LLAHGDIATLSFHATKVFHTAEGGALVCRSREVAERVSLMSRFGHSGEEAYLDMGINAKLSELHAAMGICVLPHVSELIAARRQRSQWYDETLAGLPLQRPVVPGELEYNFAYYPVVFPSHETMQRVRDSLMRHDIFPRRYFYPSLNTLPYLPEVSRTRCPVSESLVSRVLALPLSHQMTETDTQKIARIVRNALS